MSWDGATVLTGFIGPRAAGKRRSDSYAVTVYSSAELEERGWGDSTLLGVAPLGSTASRAAANVAPTPAGVTNAAAGDTTALTWRATAEAQLHLLEKQTLLLELLLGELLLGELHPHLHLEPPPQAPPPSPGGWALPTTNVERKILLL
jgi:hypothetical protein